MKLNLKAKLPCLPTIVLACLMVINSCKKEQVSWNQFRGPNDNMLVTGELPETWNDSTNIRWTYPLTGAGWSSPITFEDKLFITTAFLEKEAPIDTASKQLALAQNQQVIRVTGQQNPPSTPQVEDTTFLKEIWRWELTCIDLKTGKEIWKQKAKTGSPAIKKHAGGTYANETPVTDGKVVIAYFGMNGVYCYNMLGKLLWEKNLGAFKTLNGWGTGSSPVLYKNMVYIQVDNEESSFISALDAATGNEKWRVTRNEKTTYSTPVIWKNSSRTELVTTGKTARSYDPETGKELWQLKMQGEMSVPSPVYDLEHIYLGNAGGRGSKGSLYAVKAGAKGDITPVDSGLVSDGVSWTLKNAGPSNPSPVLYNGLIYLLGGRGGDFSVIDAATGSVVYAEKVEKTGACWASPWIYNDKVYFYDEKGITNVLQAGKDFKVLDQNILNDKFWSSVAVAGDCYIFKGVEKVYCIGN